MTAKRTPKRVEVEFDQLEERTQRVLGPALLQKHIEGVTPDQCSAEELEQAYAIVYARGTTSLMVFGLGGVHIMVYIDPRAPARLAYLEWDAKGVAWKRPDGRMVAHIQAIESIRSMTKEVPS